MTWQQSMAQLDLQISELEHRLYSLRKERNSMLPICRLPHETLEQIILILRDDLPNKNHYMSRRYSKLTIFDESSLECIRVMGTCQRFRDVMMESSILWSKINMNSSSSKWIDICLQRSINYPLTVSGSICHWHSRDLRTRRILDTFPRAHHMQITLLPLGFSEESDDGVEQGEDCAYDEPHDCAFNDFNDNCLENCHPNLSALEIYVQLPSTSPWSTLFVDENFLGGRQVALTYLLLYKVGIESVPHMPLLEWLILDQAHFEHPPHKLRDVLVETPNLKRLRVEEPFDPTWPVHQFPENIHTFDEDAPVKLPYLTSLQLIGGLAQIPAIIQILPPLDSTCDFELAIHEEDASDYHNLEVYAEHLMDISPAMLDRIAQYLLMLITYQESYELTCTMDLNLLPLQKIIKFDLLRSHHGAESDPPPPITLRLICDAEADVTNLLCYVTTLHLRNYENLFAYVHQGFNETKMMQQLIVSNVAADPQESGEFQGDVDDLECILEERANTQGRPIEYLVMRYYEDEHPNYSLDMPSPRERELIECTWKNPGWVSTVEWELCGTRDRVM